MIIFHLLAAGMSYSPRRGLVGSLSSPNTTFLMALGGGKCQKPESLAVGEKDAGFLPCSHVQQFIFQ